jgi:D-aminopeptidase
VGGLQGIGGIETNTLSVAEGIAGAVEWTLAQHGNAGVISVNAVVGAVAT